MARPFPLVEGTTGLTYNRRGSAVTVGSPRGRDPFGPVRAERNELDRHLLELQPAASPHTVRLLGELARHVALAFDHQNRLRSRLQMPAALAPRRALSDLVVGKQLEHPFVGAEAAIKEVSRSDQVGRVSPPTGRDRRRADTAVPLPCRVI